MKPLTTYLKNLKQALTTVYSEKKYFLITGTFALFVYSLNAIVHNYSIVLSNFSFSLIYFLVKGLPQSMSFPSLILMIITSILSGVLLSMSFFVVRRQITTGVYAGSGGIVASLIAPACPSCALGLFGTLGISGFLSFLPFGGLELGILGIIIIVLLTFYLSGKIVTNVCEIKK